MAPCISWKRRFMIFNSIVSNGWSTTDPDLQIWSLVLGNHFTEAAQHGKRAFVPLATAFRELPASPDGLTDAGDPLRTQLIAAMLNADRSGAITTFLSVAEERGTIPYLRWMAAKAAAECGERAAAETLKRFLGAELSVASEAERLLTLLGCRTDRLKYTVDNNATKNAIDRRFIRSGEGWAVCITLLNHSWSDVFEWAPLTLSLRIVCTCHKEFEHTFRWYSRAHGGGKQRSCPYCGKQVGIGVCPDGERSLYCTVNVYDGWPVLVRIEIVSVVPVVA